MDFEDRIENCADFVVNDGWQNIDWEDTKKNLVALAKQIYEEAFKEAFLYSGEGFNGDYTSKFGTVHVREHEKRQQVADYAYERYLQEKEGNA